MTTKPFGMDKEEGTFEEFIGMYVIIYPASGAGTFTGKLTKIKGGFGVLNPHMGGAYGEKGMIKKLVYKNSKVNLTNINCMEPTTRRDLEAYCHLCNSENQKDSEKSEQ